MFPFWMDITNSLWLPWWTAVLMVLSCTWQFLWGR